MKLALSPTNSSNTNFEIYRKIHHNPLVSLLLFFPIDASICFSPKQFGNKKPLQVEQLQCYVSTINTKANVCPSRRQQNAFSEIH